MKAVVYIAVCFTMGAMIACKQEYPLPRETNDLDLLVVEGLLNSSGPTVVRVSRTFNPTDIGTVLPVANAEVTVEGEDNTMFLLSGNNSGEYTNSQLPLDNAVKYRLRIKTTGGKEYLSDFVPVQTS